VKKITFLILTLLFLSIGFYSVLVAKNRLPVCANSITCINSLEAEVDNNSEAIFLGNNIPVPQIDLETEQLALNIPKVLGTEPFALNTPEILGDESGTGEKHIYVDLSKQTLYAYEGSDLFFQTLISSGKWGRTPTGDFKIWIKIRAQKMSGGSGSTYYYLPNVPYIMFFYNSEVSQSRGFSLHGTYWHNNFGYEMSHGCVNMKIIDAKVIYDWASPTTTSNSTRATTSDPGTVISICDNVEISEGETPLCSR
jgi:hypothetical protein